MIADLKLEKRQKFYAKETFTINNGYMSVDKNTKFEIWFVDEDNNRIDLKEIGELPMHLSITKELFLKYFLKY